MAEDTGTTVASGAASGAAVGGWWGAVVGGGLALASSLLGESDRNDQMIQQAQQFGITKAGIEVTTAAKLDALISQAATGKETNILVKAEISKSQAKAEAQARVAAAQAGVSGASVNQVVNETEVNAINAEHIANKELTNSKNQLQIDFVDTVINAETQIGVQDTSTRDQTLTHTLAFARGFASGF